MTEAGTCGDIGVLDAIDYVYFAIADINGIPRGQVIPKKYVKDSIKNGLHLLFATLYMGPQSQFVGDLAMFQTMKNGTWQADVSTLQVTPWSDVNTRRTAMVLCDLAGQGVQEEADTRQMVKRLLDRLWTDHGLTLKSAFEFEFSVYRAEDGRPLGSRHDQYLDLRSVQPAMDLVLELSEELREAGVDVLAVAPELGAGQWELNVQPQDGLAAADLAFHVKNAVKVFFRRRGYEATFMSVPEVGEWTALNTLHFNHSLWTSDGRNVMRDDVRDDGISEVASRWNAGLLRHAGALSALCCPTVNCQRGLAFSAVYSPRADWSVECRNTMTRFKVAKGNVFLESRLGTGPASPYLLIAAHLVAGMSGLQQEMTSPPPEDKEHAQMIPTSLDEALRALEADDVMKDGLGRRFVSNYVTVKRHYDVNPYQKLALESDDKKLEFERKQYFTTY